MANQPKNKVPSEADQQAAFLKKAQDLAAKEKADVEAKAAAAAEAKKPKPIVPVEPTNLGNNGMSLTPYKANEVAEFGNKFMMSLVMQAGAEEEAQKALNAAGELKQYLQFEMTRAVFDLSIKYEDGKDAVDIYAVFGEAKDVEKLNRNVLIRMGVLKREIGEDDTVKYVWTSKEVEQLYAYTKQLKEDNPSEYDRRFNNRKRLNMRLNDAFKATAVLRDQKLTTADLFYSEDDKGQLVPTIKNAPKAIGGEAGIVQMNSRTPVKGATLSPTMSSLVKLATERHKAPKADRTDKGEQRQGEAKLGMDDETFGRAVNLVRQAITAQENVYTEDMVKHIQGLIAFLEPLKGITATKPTEPKQAAA